MQSGRCNFLKKWDNWDISIHEDEAQIARQGKALSYPFDFKIDETAETARFSSTSDLPYYETTLTECTCYDFQTRQLPCKHIYRLAVELGVIEIIKRTSRIKKGDLSKSIEEVNACEDIDNHPEQVKRAEKAKGAKMKPLSIDYENKTALFAGSGKEPYKTDIGSCTCRDFILRKLPCKHIYRLRMELQEGKQLND